MGVITKHCHSWPFCHFVHKTCQCTQPASIMLTLATRNQHPELLWCSTYFLNDLEHSQTPFIIQVILPQSPWLPFNKANI